MSTQIREQSNNTGLITYLDGAYPNSIVSGSLVWKDMDRKNADTSLINGASYTNSKFFGGVTFDGVDDYVSIPYRSLTTEPFAVEIWMDHVTSSVYLPGILSCGDYLGSGVYGSPGWCIGYWSTNGTRISAAIGDSTSLNRYVHIFDSTPIAPFNKPMHIFFHRNTEKQTLSLFLNGQKTANSVINFTNDITIGGANRTSIGARTWGFGSNVMPGTYYMIKLYLNNNFSESQIIQKFTSTRERFGV
jgi:hypothetical protein